jgi:hypothetical protein
MYKIRYFDGKELEMNWGYKKKDLITLTKKNRNIYQIIRNNRTQEVVWERECEAE